MSKKIKKEQLESIKELVTRESNLSKDIVSIELTKFKVIQDLFRASDEIKDSKEVYGGHIINDIIFKEEDQSYNIFITKNNEVLPWKKFNRNMAVSVEFDLKY